MSGLLAFRINFGSVDAATERNRPIVTAEISP